MATSQYRLYQLVVFFWLFSTSLQDDACRIFGCGEGRCVKDDENNGLSSYHCECNRGWKTMRIAPMPFPSCIVPNCTMDFTCGGRAPPPPPPPPAPPLFNITNVCNFVWCGDGDCVPNGSSSRHYYCRCHGDADNVQNNSTHICIKKCAFRADCNHLGIGLVTPPSSSPHLPFPPPPPPSSAVSLFYGKYELAYIIVVVFMGSVLLGFE